MDSLALTPDGAAESTAGRFGVLDIGSNSIRLVVFDHMGRAPFAIFNEKVLCGLGRGLETTGALSVEGMAVAMENIARYAAIARAMRVEDLVVLATAAVREASNGRDFVATLEERFAIDVKVITGEEEARLSALGVLSAIPEADGLVADLGGGSLEVVDVSPGRVGPKATLPLGPLRLADYAEAKRSRLRAVIDEQLDQVGWLSLTAGRSVYAVGGAWRSLARAHMAAIDYPLHVIHHYVMGRDVAVSFLQKVQRDGKDGPKEVAGVSRRRIDGLPHAAAVLERLLVAARPARLVFCAQGLREGCLFDRLPETAQAEDPLLAAATRVARASGRFDEHGGELDRFTAPLFPDQPAARARLRLAACLLSDIAWVEHPDYRAEHAYTRILRLPIVGIDHPGRGYLALAVATRYVGDDPMPFAAAPMGPLGDTEAAEARVLGLALRLAHTLTGGVAGVLDEARLRIEGGGALILELPDRHQALFGDVVRRRLDAVGRALGLSARLG